MENNSYTVLELTSSYFSNDIYLRYIYDKKYKIAEIRFSRIKTFVVFTSSYLFIIYLIITNLFWQKKLDFSKFSAVGRVEREHYKIKRVYEDIQIILDDIVNKDYSLFLLNRRLSRIYFMLLLLLPKMIIEYNKLSKIFKNESLKIYKKDALIYFTKRIAHLCYFEFTLDTFLKSYKPTVICTGAIIERFALVTETLTKKHFKKLIAIPHGVEGPIYLPKGYVGDLFYTTNPFDADALNDFYITQKFVYDFEVAKKMFRINPFILNQSSMKLKLVIVTQPDYDDNYSKLFFELRENGYKDFFVRVHPLEDIVKYKMQGVEIINDLGESISNSICIGVFSTSLLEALFNNSKSISLVNIFHNEEEASNLLYNTRFLLDEKILKPNSYEELFEFIKVLK